VTSSSRSTHVHRKARKESELVAGRGMHQPLRREHHQVALPRLLRARPRRGPEHHLSFSLLMGEAPGARDLKAPTDPQLTFVPPELETVLSDLNPWWTSPHSVRPQPLIQVIRGPRQVGKTTAILQMVTDPLATGVALADLLLLRFDLQTSCEAGGLLGLVRWYETHVRRRPLGQGALAFLKTKSITGASGRAGSSQFLLRRPSVSIPFPRSASSAFRLTTPVGWLPAEKALNFPWPIRFSTASAMMLRAELPVHRNRT